MAVPTYVLTEWDVDLFRPGPGLPDLNNKTGVLVSDQTLLDALLLSAGRNRVELRFSKTGTITGITSLPDYADKTFFNAVLARNPDMLIVGTIVRDASGVLQSANVIWPDGTLGTLTVLASSFGAVDSWQVTYGSPATKRYTQPTVTRDSTGAVSVLPAIVVD